MVWNPWNEKLVVQNALEQLACSKIVRSPECEAKDWTLELALHLLQASWKKFSKNDFDGKHILRDINWQCPEVILQIGQGWKALVSFLIHQALYPHALVQTITFSQHFVKWYTRTASRQAPYPPQSKWSQRATISLFHRNDRATAGCAWNNGRKIWRGETG